VFSIFKLAKRPLALVSTFCVLEFIVNGPNKEDVAVSIGKSFKSIVTIALPSKFFKIRKKPRYSH
jgi:hypothetical protein